MRLITRTLFWLLSITLLLVGSAVISAGIFVTLDNALGDSALNVWGDMEGLVVPVWVTAAALFSIGLVLLIGFVARRSRGRGSA